MSCALALFVAGCGDRSAAPPKTTPTAPTASEPCTNLCDDEARCGSKASDCTARCTRDEKILRDDVVRAVVACRRGALQTTCAGEKTAFSRGDLLADTRCLALAVQSSTDANRRVFSEASCDRMFRCQTTEADVASIRPICISSTMAPKEQEEREAMLVVDALRPEVVARWAHCLTDGACPAAGKSDDVAEACLLRALERK